MHDFPLTCPDEFAHGFVKIVSTCDAQTHHNSILFFVCQFADLPDDEPFGESDRCSRKYTHRFFRNYRDIFWLQRFDSATSTLQETFEPWIKSVFPPSEVPNYAQWLDQSFFGAKKTQGRKNSVFSKTKNQ